MGRSVIYNREFNGLEDGINYFGDNYYEFVHSVLVNNSINGTMETDSNVLLYFNGVNAPDPWGSAYSNYSSDYVDLTLDLKMARFFDGREGTQVIVKSPTSDWAATWISGPTNSVKVTTSTVANALLIISKGVTRKSVGFTQVMPFKIRYLYDENDLLSVYINDSLYTTYQFVGAEIVEGAGAWGCYNYGPYSYEFNSIRLIGDRRDSVIF